MQTHETSDKLRTYLDDLKTLRDELRVKIHLAGLDARDTWDKLERQVEHLEPQVMRASGAAAGEVSKSLESLAAAFRDLKARIEQPPRK